MGTFLHPPKQINRFSAGVEIKIHIRVKEQIIFLLIWMEFKSTQDVHARKQSGWSKDWSVDVPVGQNGLGATGFQAWADNNTRHRKNIPLTMIEAKTDGDSLYNLIIVNEFFLSPNLIPLTD